MAYTIQSTEKVKGIGADYETKALLYLMCCREDSYEIYSFAVDFFNDVTGLDSFAEKAWDVQSKGKKANCAKDIGRDLVTLYKNYVSDLHFDYMILFLASVPDSFRVDGSINSFGIENINPKALHSVKSGLLEEVFKKTYILSENQSDSGQDLNIDSFLSQVIFVIDDKTKAEYIKNIVKMNPQFIQDEDIFERIFNGIRNKQSELKNENVEGEVITNLSDVYKYNKILKTKEIKLYIINTVINHNILEKGIPTFFIPVIEKCDSKKKKEIVEDCHLTISKLLFDKTNTDNFWEFLELIWKTISDNPVLSTDEIFELIRNEDAVRNPRLDILTVKYIISVVKEALA